MHLLLPLPLPAPLLLIFPWTFYVLFLLLRLIWNNCRNVELQHSSAVQKSSALSIFVHATLTSLRDPLEQLPKCEATSNDDRSQSIY